MELGAQKVGGSGYVITADRGETGDAVLTVVWPEAHSDSISLHGHLHGRKLDSLEHDLV